MNILKKIVYWAEKRLKLDVAYFGKNIFYMMIGSGVYMASAFLLSVAFARLAPQEVYGQFNYVLSIMGLIAILALPGINTAITQAVAKGDEGVFTRGTKTKIKWAIWGSLVSIGFGVYYYVTGSSQLAICFFAAALLFPGHEAFDSYRAFLNGKKDFKQDAKYYSSVNIIAASLTIAVLYLTADLMLVFITYFASVTLVRAFSYVRSTSLMAC